MDFQAKDIPLELIRAERFWKKVHKTDGCWLWMGWKASGGYGKFKCKGGVYAAHRVSYLLCYGTLPTDLVVDHICFNRACVNPEHLQLLPLAQNSVRRAPWFSDTTPPKRQKGTHCKRGHELTPENIYTSRSGRQCKTCASARHKERRQARKRTG